MVMTPHHLTQAFPRAPEPHCEVGRISRLGALARPGLKLQFSKGAPVPLIKSLFRGAMPPLGVEVGRFESGVKAPLLRMPTTKNCSKSNDVGESWLEYYGVTDHNNTNEEAYSATIHYRRQLPAIGNLFVSETQAEGSQIRKHLFTD
ncbi:hypothetical protein AVEN_270287-1 [Araneus ventricosus]|uniref:Uncharacterized protein n=1 Tax=Araneus ventricosus TaxID=182803 RepID=A0A4Y2W209_ARAVE|nr:hypothetical protein AVEN_129530-1 [Araneus ventricosus]GBO31092.1 hypothetical protein AVEN_270287-1 [Araneus ventricosus]